ncbi:MAG: tRNA adenosine(34) deaminase TadA [Clostridia bacterium]|nr:tRNA adenosine(34) deaminase TadA [Clostridia bacterium]MBQ4627901.1 tRNA adenosine(34) deaminase TadA [Clostridia bacterium]
MHEVFMKRALSCAKKAAKIGEVPVGAVVVRNGEVVSTGYNRRETDKNALRHAEITAIDRACKKLGGWRLWECDLYVTLEPCPMCAGAIINSRIRNVYVGAPDPKNGAMGSVVSLQDNFTHKPNVVNGIMKDECAAVLSDFFKDLRERKRNSRSQNG